MLNAAHSALAYLGYLSGAETVAEASMRADLAAYITGLWHTEIIPALTPPPAVDLHDYAAALLARFRNPAIHHRTWQIAMDGSLKLPPRLLGTLADNLAAGRGVQHMATALAAWMQYASGRDLSGNEIDLRDPLAEDLRRHGASSDPVSAYLSDRRIFPAKMADAPALRTAVREAHGLMRRNGVQAALAILPRTEAERPKIV
jgi:fructuronate reductase